MYGRTYVVIASVGSTVDFLSVGEPVNGPQMGPFEIAPEWNLCYERTYEDVALHVRLPQNATAFVLLLKNYGARKSTYCK